MNLKKSCKWLLLSVSATLFSSVTVAASVYTDSNGVVTGASGVIVNGQYYDVIFKDGTCGGFYSCAVPFLFNTAELAVAASEALDSQVFLGAFDSSGYFRTRGCAANSLQSCWVTTMYAYKDRVGRGIVFLNYDDVATSGTGYEDVVSYTTFSAIKDTAIKPAETWAIWSVGKPPVVPVPGAAWLFGSALAGLISIARRRGVPQLSADRLVAKMAEKRCRAD